MKIQTQCVPCLLKRIIFEAEQSTKNPKIKTKVIRNACKVISDLYDPNGCSAEIATDVHRLVYETLGDDDPYKDLKNQSNKVAMSLVAKVEKLIEESNDPLKMSMLCSIVGNTMDFGIEGVSTHPETLRDIFEEKVADGLGYDDSIKLKKLLKKSKNVLLFTDNCGEIVFDKILCRELKKFNPKMFLTLVVKGKPILSDATIEDAEKIQFEEVVDKILTTGCFAVGVDFSKISSELNVILKQVDLTICKGMANYESFSETNYYPIAYLMRTKCEPIATSMNIPANINAIKIYE